MSSKVKIVFLTDCLANLEGGAERQIYELATRLDKDKYECMIASLECGSVAPRDLIEEAGIRLSVFPVTRIYGISGLVQGIRFYKFIKSQSHKVTKSQGETCDHVTCDLVTPILITYHFSSDIWGTFWGHLAGVRTIISNRRDMGFWRKKHHARAYRLFNRWVTKIIVVAKAVKELVIREEGVEAGKIEVIYNGIESSGFPSAPESQCSSNLSGTLGARGTGALLRQELGITREEIVLMCVANLRSVKGHEFLLRAFAQIAPRKSSASFAGETSPKQSFGGQVTSHPGLAARAGRSQVKLVLIGDGELRQELEKLAGTLGLWPAGAQSAKVFFLGKRKDARELLQIADICILPSLSEGLSNAILEYMAAGKPVVATRVGGNTELVVHNETGILVEPGTVDPLAGALSRLLADENLRKRMGAAGRQYVEVAFSMAGMISKYEGLFEKLIH